MEALRKKLKQEISHQGFKQSRYKITKFSLMCTTLGEKVMICTRISSKQRNG